MVLKLARPCEVCLVSVHLGSYVQPFWANFGDGQGRQEMNHVICDPCAAELGLIEL